MKCKHCEFLENTFGEIQSNREYWLYTEMFVYLHNGDECNQKTMREHNADSKTRKE